MVTRLFNPGLRERLLALPLGAFPEGATRLEPEGGRPSGKRPRRPTASANMRLPRRSPWIATLCIVRNFSYGGRLPRGQCKEWHVPTGGIERSRVWLSVHSPGVTASACISGKTLL